MCISLSPSQIPVHLFYLVNKVFLTPILKAVIIVIISPSLSIVFIHKSYFYKAYEHNLTGSAYEGFLFSSVDD